MRAAVSDGDIRFLLILAIGAMGLVLVLKRPYALNKEIFSQKLLQMKGRVMANKQSFWASLKEDCSLFLL
jgi:hypothetical protein